MKKITKLNQSCWVLLLGLISCSKATEEVSLSSQSQKHSVAKTSSVSGYWKDNTTTVTSINIYPGYQKKVLYSIGPISVQAGDVISAHFQQELTYGGNANAMAGSAIVVATSNTAVDNSSAGFIGWIAGSATSNLSVAEEVSFEVMGRTGSYKFNSAASDVYINAVCYGASTANVPDFTVPAGNYGELVAVLESGITWNTTTAFNLPYSSSAGKYYVPFNATGALYRQYSYGPVNIPAETMVDVRFEVEATSEVPLGSGNQTLGRTVIQSTTATATSGTLLTKQIQGGITKGEHHWTASHAGGAYYPAGVSGAYFNSILYCKGTWSGQPIYIEGPTTNAYGHMVVETRPYAGFWQDVSRNITSLNSTQQVLYSIGPIDIAANQVVEIRYQAAFQPSDAIAVDSKIIRATSPTATTGVTVQPPLARRFHPNYGYNNIVLSTAERPATAQAGQYYNIVVWRLNGATSCSIPDWGELEVVKR